jgi:hypothetical protein
LQQNQVLLLQMDKNIEKLKSNSYWRVSDDGIPPFYLQMIF